MSKNKDILSDASIQKSIKEIESDLTVGKSSSKDHLAQRIKSG